MDYTIQEDNLSKLSAAIINAAIDDYKRLKNRQRRCESWASHGLINLDEIERFFKSDWFELLLSIAYPDGEASQLRDFLGIR